MHSTPLLSAKQDHSDHDLEDNSTLVDLRSLNPEQQQAAAAAAAAVAAQQAAAGGAGAPPLPVNIPQLSVQVRLKFRLNHYILRVGMSRLLWFYVLNAPVLNFDNFR